MATMIRYCTSNNSEDLIGILSLQKANLLQVLTPEQIQRQGFVTVSHTYDQLKAFHDIERHIIAKDNDKVVAYLLAMTQESSKIIPVLIPMFNLFGEISYQGKFISDFRYIVVGQACVDKQYRGQGVFDRCYMTYKNHFMHRYDFAITEIASSNTRSLAAHTRIGFREIARYIAPDKVEWCIVMWSWRGKY